MTLKIIYAGTPEFSVAALAAIHQSEHQIEAVYTQPDRPSGRGKKLTASPVKEFALQNNLAVCQPTTLKTEEALNQLKQFDADVMVVTAYGLILPKAVLDSFRLGCINIHASLLPKWRGAAPIQRAIEFGDKETGITIMQMDEGLDTGDMLLSKSIVMTPQTTAETLHDELMSLGADNIVTVLDQLEQHKITAQKQDENLTTYAHKMTKAEGQIDWSLSAKLIDQKIRAFYPWPGSVALKQGKAIKIHRVSLSSEQGKAGSILMHDKNGLLVACGEGAILVEQLQIPGKKRVLAKDLAHSKNWAGETFDEYPQN